MAYFATIDENNIVKRVEVVENDIATTEQAGIEFLKQLHGSKFNFKQIIYRNKYTNSCYQ